MHGCTAVPAVAYSLVHGFIFVQKAVLVGLFLGEIIFGEACHRREFFFQIGLGLTIKRQLETQR